MHSKPTVVYICEEYQSGNSYYFKQEFLMENEHWGARRPISRDTYLKRKKDGFKTEHRRIKNTPAAIVCLSTYRDSKKGAGNHVSNEIACR